MRSGTESSQFLRVFLPTEAISMRSATLDLCAFIIGDCNPK